MIQNSYTVALALCGVCFLLAAVCIDYIPNKQPFSTSQLNAHTVLLNHDNSQAAYISSCICTQTTEESSYSCHDSTDNISSFSSLSIKDYNEYNSETETYN